MSPCPPRIQPDPACGRFPVVKGASLGGKVLAGGVTGAGIGTTQGLSDTRDLTDWRDAAGNAGHGAVIGAGIGGSEPLVGSGLGAAYRTVAPFFARPVDGTSRVTTGLLANALSDNASTNLDRLGPQAMLADASPSMQGLAQGVAAKPGPSADMLAAALADRQAGQAGRLASDLNENLGPAISRSEINAGMDARQAATGPMYETALSSAPPLDITRAAQALENAMLTAKGRNVGRLNDAQTNLQAPYRVNGRVVPERDPRALQQAKFALDNSRATAALRHRPDCRLLPPKDDPPCRGQPHREGQQVRWNRNCPSQRIEAPPPRDPQRERRVQSEQPCRAPRRRHWTSVRHRASTRQVQTLPCRRSDSPSHRTTGFARAKGMDEHPMLPPTSRSHSASAWPSPSRIAACRTGTRKPARPGLRLRCQVRRQPSKPPVAGLNFRRVGCRVP